LLLSVRAELIGLLPLGFSVAEAWTPPPLEPAPRAELPAMVLFVTCRSLKSASTPPPPERVPAVELPVIELLSIRTTTGELPFDGVDVLANNPPPGELSPVVKLPLMMLLCTVTGLLDPAIPPP